MQTRVLFSLTAALMCAVFTSATQAQSVYENWFLSQTLTNPTPASSDYFGYAVSGVGTDKVLIGADSDDTGANNAGSAYLYSINGTLLTTYTNPTPASGDYFGFAVSVVGNDKVLIGAVEDNTGANNAGSAYLYSTDGTLLTTYTNPTPASSDFFGFAVSGVGNDKVLIGAWSDDTGANNAGSAYLFSTDGTLLTTYTNPTPASGDNFGFAVSGVGNDQVLIGAYQDDTGTNDAGSAYLFSTDGTLLSTYTNPTPASVDNFGYAVSGVGNDQVLIGAYRDDTGTNNAGSAYLFGTDGTLLTTYTNPTPANSDYFGIAVSGVGNNQVLIGAYLDDTGTKDAGSAYLFSTDGTLLTTYTNPTPASSDNFGRAVSGVGNDQVLIGAYRDDTGTNNAGSAYLYEVLPQLSMDRTPNPDIVRVSWKPASVTDWVLQITTGLSATNWINAPSGTNNPAQVPATFPARFFRLNKP